MNADSVKRLLHDALVIDSHNDTIVKHIRLGYRDLFDERSVHDPSEAMRRLRSGEKHVGVVGWLTGPQPALPKARPVQINPPLMRSAGIDVAFFAVDVTTALKNHLAYALDAFGWFLSELDRHPEEIVIVRKADDMRPAKEAGKLAAILAIEHADGAEGSLHILRALHEFGVRSIGLTHNRSSLAADGCMEARDGVGLTRFGVDLVQEMNRLGVLVDLAHVSPGAFYHAVEISEKPVIFSHGNAKALCPHVRNLDDTQLAILGKSGGVIGVSFVPDFIDQDSPTITRLVDHIDHICEVAGVDAVGIGSDFDGGGDLLTDATDMASIVEELDRRNYSGETIRKILGGNTMRVLEAALG